MQVPFVDLSAQYQAHKEEFDTALAGIITNNAFIGGEPVREFERRFAEALGVKHCVSCGNGTDAIYIALRMLGIGAGDEVITTASTWIATSETISQTGATPVFVDVDEHYLIDPEQLRRSITTRTRAVIPVHLYGQPASMSRIKEICDEHRLKLLEDCAQAHLAEWDGQRVGSFGDIGTFSFYPGKNLGAWGDAGAIVTNSDDLANSCRMFANHGALVKHQHEIEGINSRMDGLQAALLSAKLNHLDAWTERRRAVAAAYGESLAGIAEIDLPKVQREAKHVYHLYVVATDYRESLRAYLSRNGIQTGIHYPTAVPLLPAYRYLNVDEEAIPNAACNQGRILSLPMYAEISVEMIEYVCRTIRTFFEDELRAA